MRLPIRPFLLRCTPPRRSWPAMVAIGATILLAASALAGNQGAPTPAGAPPDTAKLAAGRELFETTIRPLLVESCASCHGAALASSGLRLDSVAAIKAGGPRGALIAPGDPEKSLLVRAVRYTDPDLRMPPSGKLSLEKIAAIERWIRDGAVMPDERASANAMTTTSPTAPVFSLAARRQHWAYRPVKRLLPPPVDDARTDIDAFLLAKLRKSGLGYTSPASKRTLIRRVTFDLTGLPPTPAEINDYLADTRPDAYERVVDRLLASPSYGERWARHWLDLVRYGESMGHEIDGDIPNAWRYRDYVVRALNADVPYDRFVQEHLAGDLIAPRVDPKTGVNDAIIATGFWWLGEGKHSPVDVKQEQADRIDNQIDVFGKAFLAQTLACARCHDHKFDPIPTRDYYGLYGILSSSRFRFASVDNPWVFAEPARRIDDVRSTIDRGAVAGAWTDALTKLPDEKLRVAFSPLPRTDGVAPLREWSVDGPAFGFSAAGEIALSGSTMSVLPPGIVHSAIRSRRFEGALRSPSFVIDRDYLHVNVAGKQGRLRLIIESFQVIRDPIYGPLSQAIDDIAPRWRTVDLRLWKGKRAYIELSDSALDNLSVGPVSDPEKPFDGWVRADAVALTDRSTPPSTPSPLAALAVADARVSLSSTLERWRSNTLTPADDAALFAVDRLLALGQLPTPSALADAQAKIAAIEGTIPAPTRALAMQDGSGADERVFVRGNHNAAGPVAPRLSLALCGRESSPTPNAAGSGRRELAEWIASPAHPLTARVMVNRLWLHHFGAGLVPTPDDFGHMGERPGNPELLDYLASELVRRGWSLKAMQRLMVTSDAYKQDSTGSPAMAKRAATIDPKNALLWRQNVRRLEAEAIRDSLLAVSGRLDRKMGGPSVYLHLTEFTDGRGHPPQGPADGDGRRSLYLAVRRNFLSPWLLAFDFPTPFTCIGRRSESNVPAQALAMLNGPFVSDQARVWAQRMLKETPSATPETRTAILYETAFGRPPTTEETSAARAFIGDRTDDPTTWAALCHVLFNIKEFVFVR